MRYQVYDPSAELQPFIKCFWSLDGDAEPDPTRQRIVPDGCMELIFHYGDRYRQFLEDGSNIIQPVSFLFGQITNYIEIAPTGITGLVAARFQPGGFTPFLTGPISRFDNKATELQHVFGDAGTQLESAVLTAPDTKERIGVIEAFLINAYTSSITIDRVTSDCVDLITRSKGQLSADAVAGHVNINRRNMERRFRTMIGMSPKQLSRVIRLQDALRKLEQKNYTSLTSLAYDNGYYDQAHFIREFREFTGISPKLFYAGNFYLTRLFTAGT